MEELETFYNDNKKMFEWSLHLIRNKKYKHKQITKKNGTKRKLSIPPIQVKVTQKKLSNLLYQIYNPPKPIHGFVKTNDELSRGIYTNAQMHIKKNIVMNIDIADFFDTINFGRVRGLFLANPFGLDEKLATKFAQLIIYNNKLPQGAPTSPIVSNLICRRMDHELINFAKKILLDTHVMQMI